MRHLKVILIGTLLLCFGLKDLFPQTVADIEGNVYKTVKIGNQTWMAENLKTTKYNDGKSILLVTDGAAWANHDLIALTTPAYFWYDNDVSYKNRFGALYNAYSVNTSKLCPTGWHVPTEEEWKALSTYLGGDNVAGMKLREAGLTNWEAPNNGSANEAGFTALPGGFRSLEGEFSLVNSEGGWWSSTEAGPEKNWYRGLNTNISMIIKAPLDKPNGVSVRCLKD